MQCHNHPTATAWYYLKLPGGPDEGDAFGQHIAELKVLLCLACTEQARDKGYQEQLFEVPYGAERKARM